MHAEERKRNSWVILVTFGHLYTLKGFHMVLTTPEIPGNSWYFEIFFQDPGKLLEKQIISQYSWISLEFCENNLNSFINKSKPAETSDSWLYFFVFYVDSVSGFFSGDFSRILLQLESWRTAQFCCCSYSFCFFARESWGCMGPEKKIFYPGELLEFSY